jgi:hypothetical protein
MNFDQLLVYLRNSLIPEHISVHYKLNIVLWNHDYIEVIKFFRA